MNRTFFSISIVAIFTAFFFGCGGNNYKELTTWNIYKGQIEQYDVEIEDAEYDHNKSLQRIVHLRPIEMNEIWGDSAAVYCGITGHDYNCDGNWDRIFYCGYPNLSDGCNSVLLQNGFVTEWEPCEADKASAQQFTSREVSYALSKLDEAMGKIHNVGYLTSTLEEYKTKHHGDDGKKKS